MFNNKNNKPMLLGEVDKPFNSNDYIYELKYDGIRAIIYASKKDFLITNRHGDDITFKYPELKQIMKLTKNNKVIFDGEIITFDKNVPSFSRLQLRSHLKNLNKIEYMMLKIPVVFIAFDILYENRSLVNYDLLTRKKYLENYLDTNFFIKTKIHYDGESLFGKVKELNLEGIVAKRKDSLYYFNVRTDNWLKIKNFKKEKFFVHGYIENVEKYSLLLGEYINNKLYYVGKVGIAKSNEIITKILKVSKTKNKFVNYLNNGVFIIPKIKVDIFYMERTKDNMLRQPFYNNKKA